MLTPGVTSFAAQWAPDGGRLLVGTSDGANGFALVSMNRDGSASKQLGEYRFRDEAGRWSADGTLVGFAGFRSGTRRVWIGNPDGSGARPLTSDTDQVSFSPFWNPTARGNVPLRTTGK